MNFHYLNRMSTVLKKVRERVSLLLNDGYHVLKRRFPKTFKKAREGVTVVVNGVSNMTYATKEYFSKEDVRVRPEDDIEMNNGSNNSNYGAPKSSEPMKRTDSDSNIPSGINNLRNRSNGSSDSDSKTKVSDSKTKVSDMVVIVTKEESEPEKKYKDSEVILVPDEDFTKEN